RVQGVATLGYERILHLEVLVGETSCPVKLEEPRRFVLGDDLERRMVASDTPFTTLYTIFHELYVPLIMDTIIRQVQALRIGRWKDAIRFELISDGNQGQDAVSCPFIKIEPGSDLRIKCLHNSFVIDPLTNREAELYIAFGWDKTCGDKKWHQVYYQVVSSEFSSASRVFGYGIMQDFFDECHENEDVHAFLHQAWFYKGFDQLVIGLAWTFSLSAISSWFVVPCSALVLLLAPFLDMGWLMDSYILIREGFAFEIKIWTTFFDISLSIGADISMIVDLAVWTGPDIFVLRKGWVV
ncbi:mediator of RNA polymerase II transcription subunit 14, partial [Tanacetum coccineum]